MHIKLWGVRGSLPTPLRNSEYHNKISRIIKKAIKSGLNDISEVKGFLKSLPDDLKFVTGGDTTCATVTSNTGNMYILDCGTGIRPLGDELIQGPSGRGEGRLNILLTHNHWDHIHGLPFFKPLYIPGNILSFYSPYKNQRQIISEQQDAPYFPASFEKTASTKEFYYLDPASRTPVWLEEDLLLEFYPLKHPCGSYAYKFTQAEKTFIFATDAEFTGEVLEKSGPETDFFHGADLLILDSQYTLDESFTKFDWGHTSYTMAVNCGVKWNIKNLVLTHHEPGYSDSMLFDNYRKAIIHGKQINNIATKIFLAREGMIFRV